MSYHRHHHCRISTAWILRKGVVGWLKLCRRAAAGELMASGGGWNLNGQAAAEEHAREQAPVIAHWICAAGDTNRKKVKKGLQPHLTRCS